jgi:hypothetical protein
VRDTVKALLEADTTLMAILTGGVYAGGEISRQGMPDAFDSNGEILPCALVRVETETPYGPYDDSSRQYLVVMFYERSGYANIDAALARVYELLHKTRLGATGVWEVVHADDVRDQEDQALACSLSYSRYVITRSR